MPEITSIGEILFDIYENGKKLGGAPFNFIYHIVKLTGKGNIISRIGNDNDGREILDLFHSKGISSDCVQIDNIHPTGRAKANLDENKIPQWVIEQNCAYDFIEKKDNINEAISDTVCLCFGTLAQRHKVSRETIQSLFGRPIKYFCDLNIRQKFFSKDIINLSLKSADILKINEPELELLNNLFIKESYNLITTALKLKNMFNIEVICVTCGGNGSYLFKEDEIDYTKAVVKNPVDTVGAGDAFAAILCTGYLMRRDIKEINKTAAEFAGEIVKITGALPESDKIYEEFKVTE